MSPHVRPPSPHRAPKPAQRASTAPGVREMTPHASGTVANASSAGNSTRPKMAYTSQYFSYAQPFTFLNGTANTAPASPPSAKINDPTNGFAAVASISQFSFRGCLKLYHK